MKPLEFNTLNNLNDYDPVKDLASQTRSGIKSMQVDVADVGIPSHVVLPVFEGIERETMSWLLTGILRGPIPSHG